MVTELLNKYIWLVQTFISAGDRGLTLDEIGDRWIGKFGSEANPHGSEGYPRRSFNNHRAAIAEVFGIQIECDRHTNRYYIPFGDDVRDPESRKAWLVDTFTVNNLLTMGKEKLANRVSIEEIPSGHHFLTEIMNSMLENRQFEIKYKRYEGEKEEIWHVNPYALKEGGRRWYLVGFCTDNDRKEIRIYALDRILSLKETGTKFMFPKDYDVNEKFLYSFGNYIPREGEKPVEIIFKAAPTEAKYIEDLPLHKSQAIIASDKDSTTFSLKVIPNKSLTMEFGKRGNGIEVISPDSVRKAVADFHKDAAKLYKKNK